MKKIADFAQIEKTDTVVEVGPGEGTLTEFLLEQANKIIAVEKDNVLAKKLGEKFKDQISNGKLKIINLDILDIENYLKIKNYVLVGNIPYYITGAIFKKFLQSKNPPKSITFVVQKEVADRIVAKDGKESILSISIKAYGEPKYGGIIKAGSFQPKPKVDSAIISIRNINKEKFEKLTLAEEKFFEILKVGFAHKRKLLIKNLEYLFDKTKIKNTFKKCALNEKIRAENLKMDDWIKLIEKLN